MAVKGLLRDKDMPADLRAGLGPVRAFHSYQQVFEKAAVTASSTGVSYDVPSEPDVFDQGDLGSCVLNATVGAMMMLLALEKLPLTMLSRLFLYYLCREKMGTVTQDSGTYTSLAVERVGSVGVCAESMWQYLDANMYSAPSPQCYPAASDNKATAWFTISATGDARLTQLEAAIRSNHPVIYGAPVGSALQNYTSGQVLTIPDQADIIGGHSTVFTGVRYIGGKRFWRIRNSWGKAWGDNGHFLIDDAYAGWDQLDDLHVMTRMNPEMF